MVAKHVHYGQLQAAADVTGVRIVNHRAIGNRHQFVIRPTHERKYQRVSHSGRKVSAVCWHGHRDFFRALFSCAPEASISSHWAGGTVTYTAATFETTYPETGHANIGSQYQPMAYRDACECRGEE